MNTLEDYLKLQNGSDIRGVAVDTPDGAPVNLDGVRIYFIARAFAKSVSQKTGRDVSELRISVGHDSRITADPLSDAVVKGIEDAGAKPIYTSLSSTPAMFMSTVLDEIRCDGAVMLTASHLPFNRNGAKFFVATGGYEKADIKAVLTDASEMDRAAEGRIPDCANARLKAERFELIAAYAKHLREIIKEEVNAVDYHHPLKGLHIVLDAGNGAGGFFAPLVLEELGANTTGSHFLEPDGMFPNHEPNPEKKEAMDAIRSAVLTNRADFGMIFDTDADRAAAVFENGDEINRNALIALIAAILAKKYPRTTVVTDSVTSDELHDFLENKLHMHHHRFKRGYRNVINEAQKLNESGTEAHLAMETSGHGAIKGNYFLDDGAYLCVMMIIELAKRKSKGERIEDLIEDLEYPADERELRFKIEDADTAAFGERVISEFRDYCKSLDGCTPLTENYEGMRVSFDTEDTHGWALLRLSLHDPLMPFNVETKEAGGVARVLEMLRPFFSRYGFDSEF
ncbi:MAG: phosphomannomutase/phosphoglucomutase [Eubacterium sp.]|nr:phosphomannomutase/phosphoglucomutase [Eubacterium sp.]